MTAKQALNGLKLNFEKNSSVEEEQDVIFNFSSSFSFPFFFISVLPKVTGTLNNFSLNYGKIIFYLFEQKSEKCIIIKFLLLLHYRCPDVLIANFEHISQLFLFLLLTLNKQISAGLLVLPNYKHSLIL